MQTRRLFIAAGAASVAACASGPLSAASTADLAKIEQRLGGRLGVHAIDTATGATLRHRQDERFAMASTFKWLLAAAILKKHADNLAALGGLKLVVRARDLLDYAPRTRAAMDQSTRTDASGEPTASLSLADLCDAIVTVSDNTAANLLLDYIGGPAALTAFIAGTGDGVTRLDRNEPELNRNDPGDLRDTTTPLAMATSLKRILLTDAVLDAAARERLQGWLNAATTGLDRLRAGLPSGWQGGDKTGTGANGAHNDVAIVTRPGGGAIVIASYISESAVDGAAKAAAHADVMRVVAREFG